MAGQRLYAVGGESGCVTRRRVKSTGTEVALYNAQQALLDDYDGAWVTVCVQHGRLANHRTLRDAERHVPTVGWCEACMAALAERCEPCHALQTTSRHAEECRGVFTDYRADPAGVERPCGCAAAGHRN